MDWTKLDPLVPRYTKLPVNSEYPGDCCLLIGKDGKETLHAWDGHRWANNSTVYAIEPTETAL